MKLVVLNNFAVGQSHLGKAVFAARRFKKGDVITKFTGPILHKDEIPKSYQKEDDRYVQVMAEHFMGPSGEVDDLINHSCNPNAGLKFGEESIYLVAIKDIPEGEEITWDYSTTMLDNEWKMRCDCRNPECRKIVADFALLDPEVQERYKEMDIIPPYILNYMNSPEYTVYTHALKQMKIHDKER